MLQDSDDNRSSLPCQRLTGLNIMVVDDSEINREVTKHILIAEGANVILANDGQHALDWLQANTGRVDFLFMDIEMPGMNGYEATRQIRQIPALVSLPIIAITAGVFAENQLLGIGSRMNDVIAKPFDIEAIIKKILMWPGPIKPTENTTTNEQKPAIDCDLPGISIEYGLSVWKEPSVYQKILRKFMDDNHDFTQEITGPVKSDAAARAHKLKGAASILGLKDTVAALDQLEQALLTETDTFDSLIKLQATLDIAFASIRRYAPTDDKTDHLQSNNVDTLPLIP